MKQTTLRDKLCNLITEMDQPLSTSFTYINTTCSNNSSVQSPPVVSHTRTPSSLDFSRIYRSENGLMKVRRSVSTFDCFMKANKIKKKIGKMNDDYFPCSKTFTTFNKPVVINSKIVNNTDFNKTILSYPISEQTGQESDTSDAMGWIRERQTYETLIKENIEYDIMVERYRKEWLDEIVSLMVDVVCSKEETIRINKQEYPQTVVKSRFLKIDSSHIEYIHFALGENASNVRNIRAFLITTIYRAPETTDNWYSAKVKHDMANWG